jgi:glyceraldehyde 3-phosphate dehydrogenase
LGAHFVCEYTGVFLTKEKAQSILDGGARKVIYSAPAKDNSQTIVMGVNADEYDGTENFVSCASCTTNGLAPMVKAIHDEFAITEAPAARTGGADAPRPATSSPPPPAPRRP